MGNVLRKCDECTNRNGEQTKTPAFEITHDASNLDAADDNSKITETSKIYPQHIVMCREKAFLIFKVTDKEKSNIKEKVELLHGVKIGPGSSRTFLEAMGFPEEKPLDPRSIVYNEDLDIRHNLSSSDDKIVYDDSSSYQKVYVECAAATKYGILIAAGTSNNFMIWAKSNARRIEMKYIPNGRLYAYIEHTEEDEGGRGGFIVHLNTQNHEGSATVKNGRGYLLFGNGNYYHGQLKNCQRDGRGKYCFATGDVYNGHYKEDKKHGKGRFTWADGSSYDGDWAGNQMHGKGIFTFANGNKYNGHYKNNKQHGKGVFTFFTKSSYDGDWEDGKKHGSGIYTYASGDVYVGCYKDGSKHGKGNFDWVDGDNYNGGEIVDSCSYLVNIVVGTHNCLEIFGEIECLCMQLCMTLLLTVNSTLATPGQNKK